MLHELYKKQVGLLVEVLPVLNEFNKVFTLKGGTAINLFHSNMPRLSVDIDLAYIKPNNREDACADINKHLMKMKALISDFGFKVDNKTSELNLPIPAAEQRGITANFLCETVRCGGYCLNAASRGELDPKRLKIRILSTSSRL